MENIGKQWEALVLLIVENSFSQYCNWLMSTDNLAHAGFMQWQHFETKSHCSSVSQRTSKQFGGTIGCLRHSSILLNRKQHSLDASKLSLIQTAWLLPPCFSPSDYSSVPAQGWCTSLEALKQLLHFQFFFFFSVFTNLRKGPTHMELVDCISLGLQFASFPQLFCHGS